MIKFIIKKSLLRVVRYSCDAITHSRDLYNIALGRHRLIFAETKGDLKEDAAYTKVAIVAVYPNPSSLLFIINLLKGLNENGFFVLVIASKKLSPELSASLLKHCHVLIERFSIGRDFASYKIGIEWIARHPSLQDIDTLALVNDSLFYPAYIGETIRNLLAAPSDWLALFENHTTKYHVQSFFEIFRKPVFTSPAFKKYWANYLPLSSRTHTIAKGETGLSRILMAKGINPFVLYNSIAVQNQAYKQFLNQEVDANFYQIAEMLISKCLEKAKEQKTNNYLLASADTPQMRISPQSPESTKKKAAMEIGKMAETSNPTHSVGLICNILFQAPLKHDLCARGTHDMCELILFVNGFTEEEKNAMANEIRRRGLHATFPKFSWRGIKLAAGVE